MLSSFFLLFLAVSKHAENSQFYCNVFGNHSGGQQWKVVELAERDSKVEGIPPKSNRETWKSGSRKQVDYSLVAPTSARRYCEGNGLIISSSVSCTNHVTSPHCPWHLEMQTSWPDFPYFENVLLYELVQSPTSIRPYYIARVRSMPNVQCQATSIDELEKNLLAEYKRYLLKLVQEKETIIIDRNEKLIPTLDPVPWNFNGFVAGN